MTAPGDGMAAPGSETLGTAPSGVLAVGQSAELFQRPGPELAGRARAATLSTVAQWLVFWLAFAVAGVNGFDFILAGLPSLAAAGLARVIQSAMSPDPAWSMRALRTVSAATGGELALLAGAALFGHQLPLPVIGATWVAGLALSAYSDAARRLELRYRSRVRRAFVLGSDREVGAFTHEVARHGGMALVGAERCLADGTLAQDPDALTEHVVQARPSVLVIADRCLEHSAVASLAWRISVTGVRVRKLSDYYETEFGKVALASLVDAWFLFDVAEIHRKRLYGHAKRVAESLIAFAVLVLAAPLMVVIGVAIKLSSKGPVLFRQARVGRDGTTFQLLKFRTMHCDPDAENGHWIQSDDPRIFETGRILRQLRLDELPQLWNVLRGDLSLVGPRPEQPQIVEELARSVPFYETRVCVRPGLTGWAQVNYGYGGSHLGTRAKLEYDLYYIKHQSLALDFKILLATVTTMLAGGGA